MKRLFIISIYITACLLLAFGFVFADAYHLKRDFTIPAGSNNSSAKNWSPVFNIPSGNLYLNSVATLSNPTGWTEYFTIKPHSTASNVGWMAIDGSLHTKTSNMAAYAGTTYKARAYKQDPSLSIQVSASAYFHSTNNS
jgi:hypothetical protein